EGDRDRRRATARRGGDRVGARNDTWAGHAAERILLFLAARGPLEREPRGPGVPEVPHEPVYALLPRGGRIDHDGVAVAVGDRDDHPSPPPAPRRLPRRRPPRGPGVRR